MITAPEIRVDGRISHEGWPQDRALQYGDGLFETMVVRNGRIRFVDLHGARLARGCEKLAIRADQPAIWEQAAQLAAQHGNALLKLLLSRGDATARGYAASGRERPRVIFSVHPAPVPGELPGRVRAVSLPHCLGENPHLAGLKHCSRLEQVLARTAMAGMDAFEGLMASSSGELISGTMSNVFVELDGVLMTPELDRCGIAGILRAVVLREAPHMGIPLQVCRMPMELLERCSALAVSNVRLGLLPVNEINGRSLQLSPALRALATRVDALDQ